MNTEAKEMEQEILKKYPDIKNLKVEYKEIDHARADFILTADEPQDLLDEVKEYLLKQSHDKWEKRKNDTL